MSELLMVVIVDLFDGIFIDMFKQAMVMPLIEKSSLS